MPKTKEALLLRAILAIISGEKLWSQNVGKAISSFVAAGMESLTTLLNSRSTTSEEMYAQRSLLSERLSAISSSVKMSMFAKCLIQVDNRLRV